MTPWVQRRPRAWAVILIAASTLAGAPMAQATMPQVDSAAAIAAALAQASQNGITFELDGQVVQRNAAGDVSVSVADGKVDQMYLREGGRTLLLGKDLGFSNNTMIARQVMAAYGIAKGAYVSMPAESDGPDPFAMWFDPFTSALAIPGASLVVDASGRASKVLVDGEPVVSVRSWNAPLAVRPPANRLMGLDKSLTMTLVGASAEFILEYFRSLGSVAFNTPGFVSAPVETLRAAARRSGWQARNTPGGVTITVTDGLGATWQGRLTASSKGVSTRSFTLKGVPAPMPEDQAQTRSTLGLLAMSQVDALACPIDCRLRGKAASLDYATAESTLLEQLSSMDVTEQTPGPDYPSIGDGMVASFGLSGSKQSFQGGLSISGEGLCLAIPIKGPGVLQRPVSYAPAAGRVGPYGTCQPA
ncbi:MAG: hypothetical protein KGP12_11625 [Actinomycetales bacterium]|nr:hypothetical protein [Actinomycetales bacterium]